MKNEKEIKVKSKFLSLVLRHRPNLIGVILDQHGWVSVDTLLDKLDVFGNPMSLEELNEVVENNNKKRFAFSDDQKKIRANQGHSVKIDLGYEPATPPEFLYHGTAKQYIDSILKQGIQKRKRHHVHLSADLETAKNVGSRHGSPVILKIPAATMARDGIEFFLSDNQVWLTDFVDSKYIQVK